MISVFFCEGVSIKYFVLIIINLFFLSSAITILNNVCAHLFFQKHQNYE